MISSEVQRTLVKSPPELWTELSDPESLARHLGELGEIRITRTEPETLVEWEAEGTTGTVEIQPSGWGTRVTLTVLRDVAEEPDAAQATDTGPDGEADDAPGAATAEPGPAADNELDEPPALEEPSITADAPAAEGTPAFGAPPADDATGEDAPALAAGASEAENDEEPAVAGAPGPETATTPETPAAVPQRTGERKPAPATEAARRAAGWSTAEREPEIAGDVEDLASERAAAEDGLQAWMLQSGSAVPLEVAEREAAETKHPPAASAEPRRGFFARLFGRRRKGAAPELPPVEMRDDDELIAPDDDAGIETTLGDAVDADAGAEATLDAAADEDLGTDGCVDEGLGTGGCVEMDEAESPALSGDGLAVLGEAAEETPFDALEDSFDAPADASGALGEATGVQEPEASLEPGVPAEEPREYTPIAAEGGTQSESEPAGSGPAAARPPVQDLAAELRAAEEVATEEVEAVLTAVLDRLGSAHHRPFSRP